MVTRRGALAFGPLLALAAGACSSKSKSPAVVKGVDKVTYMTGFGTFGREGYVYVADAKGFFRDAGLDVKVVAGTGQPANLQELIAGKVDFYAAEFSQDCILQGKGTKGAKAIFAVHQRTVIALMALKSSGISQPRDLRHKTIAYGGAIPYLLFGAYAKLAGFDPSTVTWKPTTPQELPALLASRRVDAIGQFVTGTPLIEAAAKGQEIVVLPYGDYLGDLYGTTTATNEAMLKNKPDVVRRFRDALIKGLTYAIDNPDESGQIIHNAAATTDAHVAAAELTVMKPYVTTGGSTVGVLDRNRVARAIALLANVGAIPPNSVTPDDFADFAMTPKA